MEGFLHFRDAAVAPAADHAALAIIPAVIVISHDRRRRDYELLVLSQVILSLQLPFAVVPLVKFTGSRGDGPVRHAACG